MTSQQMQDTILSVESRCFNHEQEALRQVRLEADQMHNERVRQLSLDATIRIQAQDVQLHSLRDVVAKLENERACRAADHVSASPDDTAIFTGLRERLRVSEGRERELQHRSDHLRAELVDCQDHAEFASEQAAYEMEGLHREHQVSLAAMTKDIDDLMNETQEQTQSVVNTFGEQLKHETQCYYDECSAARLLRSEIAVLVANQTRPASPASNHFRSPFGLSLIHI